MKVLVFGSRQWVDQRPIELRLEQLPPGTIIVHGAARGVDNIAGYVASKRGFIVRAYPALRHGRTWPSAGILRNQEMLDEEHPDKEGLFFDLALCWHEDPALGKGSKDMNSRVQKATPVIPVEIRNKWGHLRS